MEILKKLTVKGVNGNKVLDASTLFDAKAKDGDKVPVATMYGIARDALPKETDKGPYYLFKGDFAGVNTLTGEEYRSGQCILPEIAEAIVAGGLADESVTSLQFAFEVGVKKDSSAIRGYAYYVVPLVEQNDSDPLAALAKQVVPQLAAPAKEKESK